MKWGYNSLRAQGRCGWCGGEPLPERTLCERCMKRAAEKNRKWRARRKNGETTDGNDGRMSNKALTAAGRCRCGLLLPCTSCLPTSAAEWRSYAGGPSQ